MMPDARHAIAAIQFAGMALAEAQRVAVEVLRQRPSVDAAVDARRLLMLAVGCEAIELVKASGRILATAEAERYAVLISRRLAGEPVSRIAGQRGFYGREFLVTPATLDPRPESETLIDAALGAVQDEFPRGKGLSILDIGTGTGCLLLTLLAELPEATGIGVDVSAAALQVANENGRRLGLAKRGRWVEGRGFAGLLKPFGLIVSNPPYIASAEIAGLDDEVKAFDPGSALDGGSDGLEIYREIALTLPLVPGNPHIFLEVGDGQAGDVAAVMRAAVPADRIAGAVFHMDMAGKQRCVAMRLQN